MQTLLHDRIWNHVMFALKLSNICIRSWRKLQLWIICYSLKWCWLNVLVCDKLLQELCLTYRLDIPGHVRSSQLGILEGRYCTISWIAIVMIRFHVWLWLTLECFQPIENIRLGLISSATCDHVFFLCCSIVLYVFKRIIPHFWLFMWARDIIMYLLFEDFRFLHNLKECSK